jgi:citrate synthase
LTRSRYLTAAEAAHALGITTTTLYAYVSRGLVHSEPTADGSRQRRYHAEDVEHLRQRQQQRRHPEQAVGQALHWGAPLLDSALTLIADGRLFYRGQDAVELARTSRFEAVAALLWTGRADASEIFARRPSQLSARLRTLLPPLAALPPIDRLQVLLPAAAPDDLAGFDLRPAAVAQTGARLLRLLAAAIVGESAPSASLAAVLAAA